MTESIDFYNLQDKKIFYADDGKIENVASDAENNIFVWSCSKSVPMYLLDCHFNKDFVTQFETTLFRKCTIKGKIIVENLAQGSIIMDQWTYDNFVSKKTENVAHLDVISDLAMNRLFENRSK